MRNGGVLSHRVWTLAALGLLAAGLAAVLGLTSVASGQGASDPAPSRSGERPGLGEDRRQHASPQRAEGKESLKSPGREITSLRERNVRVFDGPGATKVARFFPSSVNFRKDGKWEAIDNTLKATAAGYENAANRYRLVLPKDLGAKAVRASEGGNAVSFALQRAQGAARVDGARAVYSDALPGVDVAYTATGDAVKEELIVEGADAPAEYVFSLGLSEGLTAREMDDGGIAVVDGAGKRAFSIAPPFMRDEAGELSRDVRYELEAVQGGYELTLIADKQWLGSPEREGAVVIDPTLRFDGAEQDCYIVGGAYANDNFCGYGELAIGYSGSEAARSLLRFDVQNYLQRTDEVLYAELGLYMFTSTTTNATPVDLHRVTQDWTFDTTWNKRTASASWNAAGGDFASEPSATNDRVGDRAGWEYWSITDLVGDWVDGDKTNRGMVLKESVENVVNQMYFDSTFSRYSTIPHLDVTYEPRVGVMPQYSFNQSQALSDRTDMRVNPANGNLLLHERDLQIAGTGMNLAVDRWYNNLSPNTSPTGGGWVMGTGWDVWLDAMPNGDVLFHGPSGYVKRFKKNSDASYKDPDGINTTLTKRSDGTYKLKWNKSDVRMEFDAQGFLTKQVDKNDNAISFAYNRYGDLVSITDTQGRQTTFNHDKYGYVTRMTDPSGRVHAYEQKSSAGKGVLKSYTDPAGKVTTYTYDTESTYNLSQITHPSGKATKFAYDARFRVISVDRGGQITRYAYDQAGTKCDDDRATVVTDPRGHKTTFCWDSDGRLDTVYDALGHKRSKEYGSNSNVLTVTGAGGNAASTAYSTTGTYDANDNLTGVSQPDATKASFAYESQNAYDLSKATDPQGNEQNFAYDTTGNLQKIGTRTKAGAAETLSTFEYNPDGTISASIDGNGHRTTYSYDAKGNPTKVTPPSPLGAMSLAHDGLSRITSMTDGKGQKRTFTYDARDRITKVAFYDSAGTLRSTVSSTYDADGNRLSRSDPAGTTSYSYDARQLLTKESFPDGRSASYAYDPAANLSALSDPTGTVTYQYNEVNLLSALTEPGGAQTTYQYNADNSLTHTTYPNGVTERREHNKAERITAIKATDATGKVLTDFSYDYLNPDTNAQSQLIQTMTDRVRNTTTEYGYDHLGRLSAQTTTGSVTESYAYRYDTNSNRLYKTTENGQETLYSYNAANQLTEADGVTYAYDANGNLTSSSDGWALAYNARNQTTAITPPGGTKQAMTYLGAGQTELFTRDGLSYLNNGLAAGQSVARRGSDAYLRSPDGRLHSQRSGAGKHYYLFRVDPGASVAALTDQSGAVAVRYHRDPFGAPKGQTGTLANPFRLASQEYIDSLGLYKMGERWYDPKLGRFTQQDPLNQAFNPRQANRYLYAGQDPVNMADPTGLHSEAVCDIGPLNIGWGDSGLVVGGGVGLGVGCTTTRTAEENDFYVSQGFCLLWECETLINGEEDANAEGFGLDLEFFDFNFSL